MRFQLSLLLLYKAWHLVNNHVVLSSDSAYTVLSRIDEGNSVVAVVRRNDVVYLLYDESIIGAEFDDPKFRNQAVFPGFTIMQCAAYLQEKPTRAIQIGLGIGTVPSFLRQMKIPTDVVEISEAVVIQAADYFHYTWCPWFENDNDTIVFDEDDEACLDGQTFVMDGLKFISSQPHEMRIKTDGEKQPYDLFIVDVYMGSNPFVFFFREEMLRIRENWLTRDGVLVMNFVGYIQGPDAAAPKSIYRTLQTVFKHVKCFRETEEPMDHIASNIVFFAADKPLSFHLPTTGIYTNPPRDTHFNVVKNFQTWEIFTDLNTKVEVAIHQEIDDEEVHFVTSNEKSKTEDIPALRVLTKANHGQDDFREIHATTESYMRKRVVDAFPSALWEEFKQKPTTTTSK